MNKEPLFPFPVNIPPESMKGVKKKRFLHKVEVIKNLYAFGPTSNADICKRLRISMPTSLSIMNELLEIRMVEKWGHGVSSGGRKPVLFGLMSDSFFSLGIDVTRFKTRIAIYNNCNKKVSETISFTSDITKPEECVDKIYNNASELLENASIDTTKLICVGLIMPGLIDSGRGINYTHLNFGSKTTREVLEEKFNRPVFIENDAKAMAHAELRFGKALGKKNVLVVFMEWGLGLGVIIEGKIYRGSLGLAGELSHIPAIDNKIYCQCGKQGCLETIASGAAISRMAIEGISSGKRSVLAEYHEKKGGHIETGEVVEAANSGDLFAISILSDTGMNLGKGLASLMQLFNPELVILSGNVCEAKQYITTPVQQALNTYCMPQIRERTNIVISELGDDQGMLGAVSLAIEYFFERPFSWNFYKKATTVYDQKNETVEENKVNV